MLYNPQWQLDDVGRLLLVAADYQEQNGWCRDQAKDVFSGHVCVMGALWEACPDRMLVARAQRRLSAYLGEWPADWNDQKCMNAKQAADALRAAARHY